MNMEPDKDDLFEVMPEIDEYSEEVDELYDEVIRMRDFLSTIHK